MVAKIIKGFKVEELKDNKLSVIRDMVDYPVRNDVLNVEEFVTKVNNLLSRYYAIKTTFDMIKDVECETLEELKDIISGTMDLFKVEEYDFTDTGVNMFAFAIGNIIKISSIGICEVSDSDNNILGYKPILNSTGIKCVDFEECEKALNKVTNNVSGTCENEFATISDYVVKHFFNGKGMTPDNYKCYQSCVINRDNFNKYLLTRMSKALKLTKTGISDKKVKGFALSMQLFLAVGIWQLGLEDTKKKTGNTKPVLLIG